MEKISTTNFYMAAAFLSLGYKIETLDKSDPKHIKFEFAPTGCIADLQKEWDDKSLMVNARDFSEAIREVKMKIHQD